MEGSSDIKELISLYRKQGMLYQVAEKIFSDSQLMALMKKTQGKIPIMFRSVDEYTCPVISGLGGTRESLAVSMNIALPDVKKHFVDAMANPLDVMAVSEGKCQRKVYYPPFRINDYFPIIKHYEHDGGAYFVSGILITKNHDDNYQSMSVRRMMYLGNNKFTILINPGKLRQELDYCRKKHISLDVAIMIGVVPAVFLASQLDSSLYDIDKMAVAGALLSKHLKCVHCKTVDLNVLSDAQIILEGKIHPDELHLEGPFGELGGYYGGVNNLPVLEVTCMTMQDNPYYQMLFPSGCEEKLPMAVNREIHLLKVVRRTVPNVTDVCLSMGGCGRFHAIVQIKKEKETDGKQAAIAAFASDADLKMVTVIDDDVNLFDPADVEWAICTRVQASQDISIIRGAAGSKLDPIYTLYGSSDKIGIDATKPLHDKRFNRTHVIGEDAIKITDFLRKVDEI